MKTLKDYNKKITAFLLTLVIAVVMIPMLSVTPVNAVASTSWGILNGSTGGQTIGANGITHYYRIEKDTTCSNTNTGGSGLTIAGGATVYIYIPANVTLTCTGKAGSGVTGGGAGIWLPSNSTLYIIGNGTISATGGAAAAGSNGGAGMQASSTFTTGQSGGFDCMWVASGSGGNGGAGGGGGGAGIGTPGGTGGAGGTGGVGAGENGTGLAEFTIHKSYSNNPWSSSSIRGGKAGESGKDGSAAADMGTLGIQSTITQSIRGGVASSTGGAYGSTSLVWNTGIFYWAAPKCNYRWCAYAGAGGGGGGSGYAAANIGKGGGGGGGGGGGQSGGQAYTNGGLTWQPTSYAGGGGTGNKSGTGSTTTNKIATPVSNETGFGGPTGYESEIRYGGKGAGAGTAKNAGTVTLAAKVTYNPQNGAATWANNNVTVGAAMPATTKPTYNGFTFAGWYDDPVGGTQYYNANNQSVRPMTYCDTTLYAHWTTNNNINVNTQALIIDAFKWAPTNNTAITINLSGNIDVNYALNAGIIEYAGQNITLNLNGKTLRQIGSAHTDIIKLAGACTLHIKDSVGGGNLTKSSANTSMSAIWLNDANANFYLDSGTITGCYSAYWGAAVCVDYGHFYMTGGTISNCSAAQYGGAVSVKNGGSFAMSGGTIENCKAGTDGGGVWLAGGTTGTMSGGVVQNCQAYTYGGGISAGGTFTMSGGVIWKNHLTGDGTGNSAYKVKGAGLYVAGTTTMTGGYIIENTSVRKLPPNVGICGNGPTFNMQGGIIWSSPTSDGYVGTIQQDGGAHYNKTGGLVDPAIDLTLENPLAPIVNIKMKENIDLTSSVVMKMKQTITLDLNGKTLTQTKTTHTDVLDLGGPTTLHIQDSVGGGTITRSDAATTVCGVYLYHNDAVLYLHSGTISNMNNQYWGSGVSVANGKFYMDGGTISGCRAGQYGGGVGCKGYFEMTGGTITGCSAAQYGGGVYFPSNCTFIMTNGTISNCTAGSSGGGVDSDGIFTMTGGSIENCTSGTCGGGVYVHSTSTFTMTDSIIKNCTAKTYGGGVYVKGSTGKFYMTRSTIEGCKALYATGGGVDNDAIFTMTDSVIQNCSVVGCGGGIYNYSTGTFTMKGNSVIENCSAAVYDATWNGRGGAICNIGTFNMEDGEICGCTTANETLGAGGVEQSSGTFNMKDGIIWGNTNSVTGERNGLYQTGGTLNKTGGYIDPKTTITLDANSGKDGTANVEIYYGDTSMPAIEKLPTRTGYAFSGFFDAASGGTQYYDAEGQDVSGLGEEKMWNKLDETMKLYAHWTDNTATLTYDANGHGTAPEAVTMTTTDATNAAAAITAEGYTFNGWNTAADGSGTTYDAGAEVKAANVDPAATTLYAQWTANEYTVTLNNGGGSGAATVTATYDVEMPKVTPPTWNKYLFQGYFDAAENGTKYYDADGSSAKNWDKADNNVTLYAHWIESAKVESMDLTLGGDIGMRYHVAVNDPALRESGTATVSIGSKKSSTETIDISKASKDESDYFLFPFNVNSIQMAQPVTIEVKDEGGTMIASESKSVEDYYDLVEKSDATIEQKEMVRALVDYGYYAQQALSATRGWKIGTDYAASTLHGSLSSTADELKEYKSVISGTGTNIKDIQLSLLLDSKTTLCIYVLTTDKKAPTVTIDGASVNPTKDASDGWWMVQIPDIDVMNLATKHTVGVNGYTVDLSALSYASVIKDNATIDAMRALYDYYKATIAANNKNAM